MSSSQTATGNTLTGAEAMVSMLRGHGVDTIFGLCGDTSLPFYDALFTSGSDIRHILSRDERHAAYMADAYARVTGRVGVCEGPSGGGATYILPGLIEAGESSIPILGITTDISVSGRGRFTLTELDQDALMRPLTKWNQVIDSAVNLPRAVRAAFANMTTGRPGSAHIGLPLDVQRQSVDPDTVWCTPQFGRFPALPTAPSPDCIEHACDVIAGSTSPVIVCGGGVVIANAMPELASIAEHLGIPVATTVSGQGALADDHPLCVGVVGSNGGTPHTRSIVAAADLLILVGCRAGSVTTERWQYPKPGIKVIHIDVDPAVIGANYPTDVAIIGDAKLALSALSSALHDGLSSRDGTRARSRITALKQEKLDVFRPLAESDERPIRPERVIATLERVADPQAIIVADPGTPCPYFSAYYNWQTTGRHFITNRAHGALGFALPAAIGAQIGQPERQCIAVMGDGSFGMSVGELETVVRLNLPITFVVFSNSVFGWIKAGQKAGFDSRFYSVDFSRTNHAAVGKAFGLETWQVRDPGDLERALREALATSGPSLVDIHAQELNDANAPVSEWIA
jgi:acetolactate synthase-1/2/3 large subunit